MKTGFRLALITLPIAAVGAGILALVVSNRAPPQRIELVERANPVRVIIAETHAVAPTIVGFGLVTPSRTFEAIAEVGGTLAYVNPALRDGQILPKGALLLRVSPTDFNLEIALAQANIRAANARLSELDVAKANRRASLEIEREALTVKTADLARAETLLTAGTTTQTSRDAVRTAHLGQRQKVLGIESELALFPTQRAVQIEQIAVYQTNLATAQLKLERSELTLPFTARVAMHNVEAGQFLKVGQTAAILDGVDRAEVEVQVPLDEMRGLVRLSLSRGVALPMDPTQMNEALRQMGFTAQVRLRLGEEVVTWPATVDRISDSVDQKTGTIGIVVQIDAAYGQTGVGNRPPLTKGMFVKVVLGAPPVSGIVLPRSSLHGDQIHIADADNRLRMITAQPKLVQGGIALFADGIPQGSRIILSTPSPVIEGLLLNPHLDSKLIPELLAQDAAQ